MLLKEPVEERNPLRRACLGTHVPKIGGDVAQAYGILAADLIHRHPRALKLSAQAVTGEPHAVPEVQEVEGVMYEFFDVMGKTHLPMTPKNSLPVSGRDLLGDTRSSSLRVQGIVALARLSRAFARLALVRPGCTRTRRARRVFSRPNLTYDENNQGEYSRVGGPSVRM